MDPLNARRCIETSRDLVVTAPDLHEPVAGPPVQLVSRKARLHARWRLKPSMIAACTRLLQGLLRIMYVWAV
jgi:hypothetical protein